jgi:hypothetical protein
MKPVCHTNIRSRELARLARIATHQIHELGKLWLRETFVWESSPRLSGQAKLDYLLPSQNQKSVKSWIVAVADPGESVQISG